MNQNHKIRNIGDQKLPDSQISNYTSLSLSLSDLQKNSLTLLTFRDSPDFTENNCFLPDFP